jgi:hypothetical protein
MPASSKSAWIPLLCFALALRLPRAVLRWTEDTWAYLAYDAEMSQAFEHGQFWQGLTHFSGLHPPGWGLFHNFLEWSLPVPMLLLLASVACSVGAVLLAGRLGWMVGFLVATSPLQIAYAAELNNYPAMALCMAWLWWARERAEQSDSPSWHLAFATALGAWVHLLVGFFGLIAAWGLGRRHRWTNVFRVAGVLAIAMLPLLPNIVQLLGSESTFSQPPYKAGLVFSDFTDRFGWIGFLLLIPAGFGLKNRPQLAKTAGACVVLILGLQLSGIAAPHQFPYFLALSVPFALLVQSGAQGPVLKALVLGVITLHSVSLSRMSLAQVQAIGENQVIQRGVDIALAEAQPGDGIYLLRKRHRPDDDKRGISAQLARVSPWNRLPRVRPYEFPMVDHRHGQPRGVGDLTIYVNDHPRKTILQAVQAHNRLFLVVSDAKGDPRFGSELSTLVGADPEQVGPDDLYRLQRN